MSGEAGLQRRAVVTAFLRYAGKVLVLRRSARVGSYQGCWAGVSGFLEDATALAQARREIREETGLEETQARLVCVAPPLEVADPELGTLWVVHACLFEIDAPEAIRLDWEHVEQRWVAPAELTGLPTVPALAEVLRACLAQERSQRG
jgi:8-oxo-dGTP pyrophosphatase MutT (NUDIX family)